LREARLRSPFRDIPVVIVTAEPMELYRRVGVQADLTLFVRPHDPGEVRAAIASVATPGHRAVPRPFVLDRPA
jgi:hypothetical protein